MKTPPPTVSVIIPTWNRSNLVKAAIESALQQSILPYEILVCDDGSNDDTKLCIEKISEMHPNVIWVPGEHSGKPAIPRNRGIVAARGEWIAFLDSDDTWLPNKIERQLKTAELKGVHAVCSNTWQIKKGKNDIDALLPTGDRIITFNNLIKQNLVHCSSVILKRKLFERAKGFPDSSRLKVGEDYALWLRIATLTDFAYISEPLLNYLDDAQNSIRVESLDHFSERIAVLSDFISWSSTQNNSISRTTLLRVLCSIIKALIQRPLWEIARRFCK